MPTVDELKAQLEQAEAAETAAQAEIVTKPVVQQIKEVDGPFIEKLRVVAGKLSEAGHIVEQDMITAAEQGPVFATLIKAVGELIGV